MPLPEDDPRWQEIGSRLEDDHLAKVVERQVNQVDRGVVDGVYQGRGSPPYDPILLLKMALYQYHKGNQSPARWWEEAKLNEAMQWLGRGCVPGRRTWYKFRDKASKFIEQIHRQIIQRALDSQLLDPTIGIQDGTTVAACASRHQMVNRPTLQKRMRQLKAIIAGQFDEDLPKWVPATESGKLDLLERMERAAEVLDLRIEKNSKKPPSQRKDPDKIKVSLSDPEAPLGPDKLKVFRPLYMVQNVVAPKSLLIMAYSCEPSVTDVGTLAPMIDKTQQAVSGRLEMMICDAAYCSIVDLQECQQRNIELIAPVKANLLTKSKKQSKQIPREEFEWDPANNYYRCPQGHRLNYFMRTRKQRHSNHELWEDRYRCAPALCKACPLAAKCLRPGSASRTIKRLESQDLLDAQRKKMTDPEFQSRYKLRCQTVELVYADSKGNRQLTRFHGRGLARVLTETGFMAVTQNLFRLDRLERNRLNPEKPTA